MIALCLGLAASAIVVMTAVHLRSGRARLRDLAPPAKALSERDGPFVTVGRLIAKIPVVGPVVGKHASDPNNLANVGVAAMLCLPLMFISVRIAALVAAFMFVRPHLVARSARRKREGVILRELPFVAEMLFLSVNSGLNIVKSLEHIVRFSEGPIAAEFSRALADVAQGRRLADALENAGTRLNDDARSLTNALVSSERYGAPLSTSLERLAHETRRAQERRAEQAGQKLSVQLVFPLAATTLPAFVALTVPPVIASSIGVLASHF